MHGDPVVIMLSPCVNRVISRKVVPLTRGDGLFAFDICSMDRLVVP